MWEQFTLKFWIEMVIAIAVAVSIYFLAKHYYKKTPEKEIKADYLRVPTNNALIVLGLLVPVFVALAAYLYTKAPEGNYSSLLATIVLFFLVLMVAVWETFAILKKASTEDTIKLKIPADLRYIIGMGLMYVFLIIGLIYFAIFFLFEITPYQKAQGIITDSKSFYYISKPKANVNASRQEILRIWGDPSSYDKSTYKLTYETNQSLIELQFDDEGFLKEITERRIKP